MTPAEQQQQKKTSKKRRTSERRGSRVDFNRAGFDDGDEPSKVVCRKTIKAVFAANYSLIVK